MNELLSKYFKVYWLQGLFHFVLAGFGALLYLFFFKNNVSLGQLFFAEAIGAAAAATYVAFRRVFFTRGDIQLGIIISAAAYALLFFPFSNALFYAYMILINIGIMTFFTPYNILFFKKVKSNGKLEHITNYFAIFTVSGIVAPPIAGYIFKAFNLPVFLFFALAMLAFALYCTRYVEKERHDFSLAEVFVQLKSIRSITAVDAAIGKISEMIIPLFSLLFLTDEVDFGLFLAVTSLVSMILTFPVAKLSDKLNNRTMFIWPMSMLSGLLVASLYFAQSFTIFFILSLVNKAASVVFSPIRSNVVQDAVEDSPINWVAREVFLNIGRAMILLLVSVFLLSDLTYEIFPILGLIFFFFPCLIKYKGVYARAR